MIIAIFVLAFIALIYCAMKSNASDPYGTFHLVLNVLPGEQVTNQRPATEWLNMGYWKNQKSFPSACEALALKVILKGKPIPRGHVLDVGHGCGDSLLLYLTSSSVPTPETLYGVTSLNSHFVRANNRIFEVQSSQSTPFKCQTKLWCDNAVYVATESSVDHPLHPSQMELLYNTITAIDCAYHFSTRETFLQQCFARLAPGGRIALGDLAISKPLPFLLRFLVTVFLSLRKENLVTIDEYKACLVRTGYTDVEVEDISDDVFPPFSNFLKSKKSLWYITALIFKWWHAAGGRFVIVGASKPN